MSFPGLDQDQYKVLWVQHQDKVNQVTGETRLELNFVIPNVELSTGKRLQPFYAPVDLDRVDLFKQITNAEHRLYDPDDPNNQQLLINKKNLPKDVRDFKAQLHQRIYRAVATVKLPIGKNWLNGLSPMTSKSPDRPKNQYQLKIHMRAQHVLSV